MANYGPVPDLKHSNSEGCCLWPGDSGEYTCMSRGHFLDGSHSTSFYKGQNLGMLSPKNSVFPGGLVPGDFGYAPTDWMEEGRLLRCPKCVILSSLPSWTLYWSSTDFYFPNDVMGVLLSDPTGPLNNYYYFVQNDTGDSHDVEGFRCIGSATGNYYTYHRLLQDSFRKAKRILEEQGIGVIIPQWLPVDLKKRSITWWHDDIMKNPDRTWDQNAISYYLPVPTEETDTFPDESRNQMDFAYSGVPPLLSGGIGYGTNVLHLYAGHFAKKTFPDTDPFTMESWPYTPECWIVDGLRLYDPYMSTGRRFIWRDMGYPYGFLEGVDSIYNYYQGAIEGTAAIYKDNFWKHPYFATKLYSFPKGIELSLNSGAIWKDRVPSEELRFWFGLWNWDEFVAQAGYDEDFQMIDKEDEAGIKVMDLISYNPKAALLRAAEQIFFPPIYDRVKRYYEGIEPGTRDLFNMIIDRNDLARHGVSYEGPCDDLLDPDGIVEVVLDHFNEHPG